jgi:surface polysaccharide O-acyltransferase-like enzyme
MKHPHAISNEGLASHIACDAATGGRAGPSGAGQILSRETSARIAILRFPLVFGVVLVHCGHREILESLEWRQAGIHAFVPLVENFFSWVVGRVSVPFLFVISGFLLFANYELTRDCIARKLSRRVKSLVIPYVVWGVLAFIGIVVIQSLKPGLAQYFNPDQKLIAQYGILDFLNGFIGIRGNYLYDSPLWFVRDLIILFILSPIFFILIRRSPAVLILLAVAALWLFIPNLGPLRSGHGLDAFVFFTLGATLALKRLSFGWVDKYGKWILILFLVSTGLEAGFRMHGWFSWQAHRINLVMGIAALWYMSALALEWPRLHAALAGLSAYSFFLYAAHMPILLKVIRGSLQALFPFNSVGLMAGYVLPPILGTALIMGAAWVLARWLPGLFRVLNGERSPRLSEK